MASGKRLGFKFNGAKLHDCRTSINLSQAALAKQLGVNSTLISKWERGLANPTFANMRELSYRFGVKDDEYWKSTENSQVVDVEEIDICSEPEEQKEEDVSALEDVVLDLIDQIHALEERVDKLLRHDEELKRRFDSMEHTMGDIAEEALSLDNRIDAIEATYKEEIDMKLVINALARMIAKKEV